jgi:hypothetical protein
MRGRCGSVDNVVLPVPESAGAVQRQGCSQRGAARSEDVWQVKRVPVGAWVHACVGACVWRASVGVCARVWVCVDSVRASVGAGVRAC